MNAGFIFLEITLTKKVNCFNLSQKKSTYAGTEPNVEKGIECKFWSNFHNDKLRGGA